MNAAGVGKVFRAKSGKKCRNGGFGHGENAGGSPMIGIAARRG
jgi:hypothetical protein